MQTTRLFLITSDHVNLQKQLVLCPPSHPQSDMWLNLLQKAITEALASPITTLLIPPHALPLHITQVKLHTCSFGPQDLLQFLTKSPSSQLLLHHQLHSPSCLQLDAQTPDVTPPCDSHPHNSATEMNMSPSVGLSQNMNNSTVFSLAITDQHTALSKLITF